MSDEKRNTTERGAAKEAWETPVLERLTVDLDAIAGTAQVFGDGNGKHGTIATS
ncbi:hypothetical protein [Tsuneonella mangrovi]|uniref:hypothetical protein n=1 Tax=Tsuneonella mangrovi TaxID=1982042 RepID=UPI00147258D3|nr:hypothetical protein [Tsuneonella mangrovi]